MGRYIISKNGKIKDNIMDMELPVIVILNRLNKLESEKAELLKVLQEKGIEF